MSIKPQESPESKNKISEIWFEQFNASSLHLGVDSILSLYSSGRSSGCVVDLGYRTTRVSSISDGVLHPKSYRQNSTGGRAQDRNLVNILSRDRGFSWNVCYHFDFLVASNVRRTCCYFAFDFDEEMITAVSSRLDQSYELPNGEVFTMSSERFRCPESVFQPTFLGLNQPGLHELVYESILNSPPDRRTKLFLNIVLTGGGSKFQGLVPRLSRELENLREMFPSPYFHFMLDSFARDKISLFSKVPEDMRNHIKACYPAEKIEMRLLEEDYPTWRGGSVIARCPDSQDNFLSKQEYLEKGCYSK